MSQTVPFNQGGYSFVKGVFQYSAGVRANPGHRIVRVRLAQSIPLHSGFRLVEEWLYDRGRPMVAFCACELRSPAPFSEAGFEAFNETYVGQLSRWGVFDGSLNPVARSNVCPASNPPAEPSLSAFCYTEPSDDERPSFVVAGSAEAPEGKGNYRDNAIRLGDTSPAALCEKADFVLAEMEARLSALGCGWSDTTAVQIYCVHDIHQVFSGELTRRGAALNGVQWHLHRPPVQDLEYEMDCRGVHEEHIAAVPR